MGGGGGTGQSASSASSSGSPLDQDRDTGPTPRETTPEAPAGDDESSGGSGRPSLPTAGGDPGSTRRGDRFDAQPGEHAATSPDADAWGMLPERTRELFRNGGSDDVPVQYRRWIDAYYRRLNRAE